MLEMFSSSRVWVPSPPVTGKALQRPSSPAEGERGAADQSLHPGHGALWAFDVLDRPWHSKGRVKPQVPSIPS